MRLEQMTPAHVRRALDVYLGRAWPAGCGQTPTLSLEELEGLDHLDKLFDRFERIERHIRHLLTGESSGRLLPAGPVVTPQARGVCFATLPPGAC